MKFVFYSVFILILFIVFWAFGILIFLKDKINRIANVNDLNSELKEKELVEGLGRTRKMWEKELLQSLF